jgi:hypothetical protein
MQQYLLVLAMNTTRKTYGSSVISDPTVGHASGNSLREMGSLSKIGARDGNSHGKRIPFNRFVFAETKGMRIRSQNVRYSV